MILPFIINKFTGHQFSITKREYSGSDEPPGVWQQDESDTSQVDNPAREQLKYLGFSSQKLLHRNGGYTLQVHAEFEAISAGRFNLSLNDGSSGIPILVVASGVPLTLLSLHEEVTGFSRGYNGKEWASSSSGNSYYASIHVLQPGDRIALQYSTIRRSARSERAARSQSKFRDQVEPPKIGKLPFSLDANQFFNVWVVNYLPKN